MSKIDDLTIIYYTSNSISDHFMANTQRILLEAVGDTPIVAVSFKPVSFGKNCKNICIGEQERSAYMIYKQVLMGVREAKTKYVATAEDDVLYPREHFLFRPNEGVFAYNTNRWSMYTWSRPPIFSKKARRTMTSLVTTRKALLNTLEERYKKYPTYESVPQHLWSAWGEPGRYDGRLGVTPVTAQRFEGAIPLIIFSTPEALAFGNLGTRKAHSSTRCTEIEPWGKAEDILRLYDKDIRL